MYVHRILLRDVRNFEAWDETLLDPWTEKPLDSVLLKGLNGSGKTTILKVIAALWENLGGWLQFGKALNATQQAQNSFLTQFGLVAIEIGGWQTQPVWLFVAATPEHRQMLQKAADDPSAAFIG
jgi:ABC-type molybdenum transport system ATPase subunit/photorepair protein PhrA